MAVAATLLLSLPLAGCGRTDPPGRTLEFSGPTMGTTWAVKLAPGERPIDASESAAIDKRIRDDLTRINVLMSTWDAGSELSRFNRSASTEPFPVSPETFDVLRWSVELAELTGGALDITVGPLVDAWGFGATPHTGPPPPVEVLDRIRAATGMHLLELDPAGTWVRKHRPEVRVDVSAIAPGYAADRLAAMLSGEFQFGDFLVDVGGELVARGRNDEGGPWRIAVERPDHRGRSIARVVPLRDIAIATSGDYRNYREVDGERVTHIVDPRTGHPVRHTLASATVIDGLCVRADALATALMVLGFDEGRALAQELDLATLLLVRNAAGGFDEWMSPRLQTLLRTE